MLWASALLLERHGGAMRQWAQAVGPVAQVSVAIGIFAGSSVIPLVFLIAVVRRARSNSILHCPECTEFIGHGKSVRQIRGCGKCPHCGSEVVSNSELDPDIRYKGKLPAWPYSFALCAFGIVFLVTAISKPLPVQFILATVALFNFGVAGYVCRKNKTRLNQDATELDHDR
jgi:predicted RNA-binding Zn-ribbon protein involved in translation (DUF1610 family)